MNEENKIPMPGEPREVPEFLKGDAWFDTDVSQDYLDFDEPYKPPRYTMERDGVPFADVGELHIISGKPGNGKTGLMSQLEAATLGGGFGKTTSRKVGHIQRTEGGTVILGDDNRPVYAPRPTRILHIDTEQGKDDTIAFKNRVISMSGVDSQEAKQHFFILRLRDTETAQDRWRKILKAIYEVQPTDIFLDGMLDIVEDYNDQKECQPIIRKCMILATYYDTSLWAVLHENPMVDKLVGTLGSITQRKVAEIFTVIKVKQCDLKPYEQRPDLPDIYFRVKQNKARGRDVADWLFSYVQNEGGWGQPQELEDNGAMVPGNNAEVQKHNQFVNEAYERFAKLNWPSSGITRADLDRGLIQQGVTSNRRRSSLINIGLEEEFLYKSGDKQRPKYHFNSDNKPLPNDQAEDYHSTDRTETEKFHFNQKTR